MRRFSTFLFLFFCISSALALPAPPNEPAELLSLAQGETLPAPVSLESAAVSLCRSHGIAPETDSAICWPQVFFYWRDASPEALPYLLALRRRGVLDRDADPTQPLTALSAQLLLQRMQAPSIVCELPRYRQNYLSFTGISLLDALTYRETVSALPHKMQQMLSQSAIPVWVCNGVAYETLMRQCGQSENNVLSSNGFALSYCAGVRQRFGPALDTLRHELFHLIDPQSSAEREAFRQESDARSRLDNRSGKNATEHMALCFVLYCNRPAQLQQSCPLSYAYLARLFA